MLMIRNIPYSWIVQISVSKRCRHDRAQTVHIKGVLLSQCCAFGWSSSVRNCCKTGCMHLDMKNDNRIHLLGPFHSHLCSVKGHKSVPNWLLQMEDQSAQHVHCTQEPNLLLDCSKGVPCAKWHRYFFPDCWSYKFTLVSEHPLFHIIFFSGHHQEEEEIFLWCVTQCTT